MAGRGQRSWNPAPRHRPTGSAATPAPARPVGPIVAVLLVPTPLVQAAWWADPVRRAGPLLIAPPGHRVLAVCPRAADAGLRPGQTVADARLRCPTVQVAAPDRGMAAAVWRMALRALTNEITPVVEAADADQGVLYLDASGLERLIGDPCVVARRALDTLMATGIAAWAGTGPSRVVARALAARMDDGAPRTLAGDAARTFLHDLPLSDPALALDRAIAASLGELGIATAGQLAALPERSLGLRYGPDVMRAWQAATGAGEPPLRRWVAPPSHTVSARLEEAVADATIVAALLARLAGDLATWLQAHGRAAGTLTLRVAGETGLCGVQGVDQDPPLQEEPAIAAAALALWGRLAVRAPVAEVALETGSLTTPSAKQAALWGAGLDPVAWRHERLTRALGAYTRRYGPGQLRQARRDPHAPDGWRWEAYDPG